MRLRIQLAALLAAVALAGPSVADPVLRSVHALREACEKRQFGAAFDVRATIISNERRTASSVVIQDGDEAVSTYNHSKTDPLSFGPGDVVRITGSVNRGKSGNPALDFTNLVIVSRGSLPRPIPVTIDDLRNRDLKLCLVRLEGVVVDAFQDEIDADWLYFILQNGEDSILLTSRTHDSRLDVRTLIGVRVAAVGSYGPTTGARLYAGNSLLLDSVNDIRVLSRQKERIRDAENIRDFDYASQPTATRQELHGATGTVIAVWSGSKILLRTGSGRLIKGELGKRPAPACGDRIALTGFPETDLYNIILVRADWKRLAQNQPLPAAAATRSAQIQTAQNGSPRYDFSMHGQAVRLTGDIRGLPPKSGGCLYLECDRQMVTVDVSATPTAVEGIDLGFTLEVAGTCVMETEKMGLNRSFPRITGYRIVVRTPDDIRILARPPWWTPNRLLLMLGLLLVIVIAIVIWNTLLRRAIARRSTELESEISARIGANLKVYERTRLAVELHDTISQNLTGVAMRLRTAAIVAESNPPAVVQQIALAGMTLDACREDLRNCLWDLRNLTLDEENVDEAIRKTLAPHIEDAELHVRFRVPRERMSDNTTHTIFSIVRELAVNAVRHGKATSIRVAGSIEGDKLLFSVKDNGCGFDPEQAPGMAQGHFGLQGIRDRIKAFDGETEIVSSPGRGTKVSIALSIPTSNEESAT